MKSLIFSLIMLFSLNTWAGVDLGLYKGKTISGEECSLYVHSVEFRDDFRHPLNELVRVTTSATEIAFELRHPPVMTRDNTGLSPKKSWLFDAKGSEQGNEAFILHMIHTDDFHGPSHYTWIQSEMDATPKQMKECLELTLQQ